MKVILDIDREDWERLQRVFAEARVIHEPPSWWQLSFAKRLFAQRNQPRFHPAVVKAVRGAARRHWPVSCTVRRSYGSGPYGGYALLFHWKDAVGERWSFSSQPIEAGTLEEWKERARFRIKWLCFSGDSLDTMVASALEGMLVLKGQRDEEESNQTVMKWFQGQRSAEQEGPSEPIYEAAIEVARAAA